MTISAGQTIGAYRVLEQVGRGGMATVYKAHQAALARYVAIKVLPAYLAEDPAFRDRFQSEAVTIAKLRHPNILQVFDFGQENGLHYIVTEFVDGGTLAEQLGHPLPVDYVTKILEPVANALDYAHARDVLHRDVKPSNILLARDGTPIVSDFGLARMMGSIARLTRTDAVVGTPEYMAPEQAAGESAGPAADRYALAIVAYEMLAGSVPYSADTPLATLIAHLHKPLPLPTTRNPLLSKSVESVILKGLAKEPGARYDSAVAFVRALEAAGREAPSAAAMPLAVEMPPQPGAVSPAASGPAPVTPAQPMIPPPAPTAVAAATAMPVPAKPADRRGLLIVGAALLAIVLLFAALERLGSDNSGAEEDPYAWSIPRGALLYDADLSSADDFVVRVSAVGNANVPNVGDVDEDEGSVMLSVTSPVSHAWIGVEHTKVLPARYAAEVQLTMEPEAPHFLFLWRVATGGRDEHVIGVSTDQETAQLKYASGPNVDFVDVSSAFPVSGAVVGKDIRLGFVKDGPKYTVLVDGKAVAQGTDERLSRTTQTFVFRVFERGTVTIHGIRVYAVN